MQRDQFTLTASANCRISRCVRARLRSQDRSADPTLPGFALTARSVLAHLCRSISYPLACSGEFIADLSTAQAEVISICQLMEQFARERYNDTVALVFGLVLKISDRYCTTLQEAGSSEYQPNRIIGLWFRMLMRKYWSQNKLVARRFNSSGRTYRRASDPSSALFSGRIRASSRSSQMICETAICCSRSCTCSLTPTRLGSAIARLF